jgi:hypothetical protein
MTLPAAKIAQPSLADLTARFLARPATDDATAAVEPHEVIAGFATDARAAWVEATATAKLLGVKDFPAATPGEWANHVRQSATVDFLPMAVGHFPQQVRDVSALIHGAKKAAPAESRGWSVSTAKQSTAGLILAAASARVSGNTSETERLLDQAESGGADATLVQNERAAILWQTGEKAAAVLIWKQLPASAVTAFNLGVAALAAGQKADAKGHLKAAVAQLPESSGWHHLAQLYLALA